jgi:hypothetical protein
MTAVSPETAQEIFASENIASALPLFPEGSHRTSLDVGRAVASFTSDHADFITGQTLWRRRGASSASPRGPIES